MASKKPHDDVLDIIHKRLVPDEEAKKARGEVFTPLPLVREMLFGLRKSSLLAGKQEVWGVDENGECMEDDPDDRVGGIPLELWRDPNTKWLDPANGIGNFPVVTFYMLDYQLANHGPPQYRGEEHKQPRRKHIVEKMLYMIEFNKGNVNTARKIFKLLVPTASSNICCADTLKMTDKKLTDVFGANRFDVVMGNPPFNQDGTKGSGRTIWPFFISNFSKDFEFIGAINILKDNGFLGFIIPSSWRNGLEPVWNTISKNHLISIKMTDEFDSVNLPIDAWLLEKKENKSATTHIIDKLKRASDVNINKLPFIPNFGINIFKKMIDKPHATLNVLGHSKYDPTSTFGKKHITEHKDATHIYPIIKTILGEGPEIRYSDEKDPAQDLIKVVIADFTYLYPHLDDKVAGLGRHAYYIPVENIKEGEDVIRFLNSELMQFMNFSIKIAGGGVQYKLLRYFPKIDKTFKSDDEIYAYFELTKDEIETVRGYIQSKLKGKIDSEILYINANYAIRTRKAKKTKAPVVAMGGAGGPPPRRSSYSSRTRRAPRRV